MNSSPEPRSSIHSDWLRIEAVLDRFEEAWQAQQEPCIADYLSAPVDRPTLLLELVKIDLEYRWKTGSPRPAQEYMGEFPELATAADELQAEEARHREFHDRP